MDFQTAAIKLLLEQRRATIRGKPMTAARTVRRLAAESISMFDTGAHVYASTQLQVPVEVANIALSMARLIPDCDLYPPKGRESEPHITVRWGLEEDDVDLVKALVADFGPIKVRLGKSSVFPAAESRTGDVVKIDVESPSLHRLNKLLARLPHTSTHKSYHPHLTLAYVNAGCGGKYKGMDDLEGEEFEVTHLMFSERSGRRHSIWLCGSRADMQTWDESKHPRGKPENKGEFAAVGERADSARSRYSADESEKRIQIRQEALTKLSSLLHENRSVPRMKRQEFEKSLHNVANNFTPAMLEAMMPHIEAIEAYGSAKQLTDELFPGEKFLTGGAWHDASGTLMIDGNGVEGSRDVSREEIYSHELGHVLDFKRRHSSTPEWQEAWAEEIDKDEFPLSEYACESASEGFAEYARLFGEGHTLQARTLPKCYACFKKWGYLPDTRPERMTTLATHHAPVSGIVIAGKKFRGGEFIPDAVMVQATSEQKSKIEQRLDSPTHEITMKGGDEIAMNEAMGTKGHTKESVAKLVGAPHGAKVEIKVTGGRVNVNYRKTGPDGCDASRVIRPGGEISNEYLYVHHPGSGVGLKIFSDQVKESIASGYSSIITTAAGKPGGAENGYYTWPRLGYDGPIPEQVKSTLPPQFADAKMVSDLMKIPEGREWWKANGRSFVATFDLSEGSQSRKVLDEYTRRKREG